MFQSDKSEHNKKTLEIFINMVMFFLNSTPIASIDDLDIILGRMSPLIFIGDSTLSGFGHKINMLVISDNKNEKTS